MPANRSRLDRFLDKHAGIPRRHIRLVLAQGRIRVDGRIATSISQVIDGFSRVQLDDHVLQARRPTYVMLHKPPGVVSATRDASHQTVIDLIQRPDRSELHIAGRLDYNSSGLVLLTNDGSWSKQLSLPENNIRKWYRVTLEQALSEETVQGFAQGIYFAYEGVTTRPAELRPVSPWVADVGLVEGKYHQVKRMFGHFNIRVLTLQRTAVGGLVLDKSLAPGQYRDLSASDLRAVSAQPTP